MNDSIDPANSCETSPTTSRLQRWLLATAGVLFAGLGAFGVFVPGLPTTIFLILASWCFTRSCPWLERRLLHNRLFAPFLSYLEPGARMPRRAVVTTLVIMWAAIAASSLALLTAGDEPRIVVASLVVGLGIVGSWFVTRLGESRARA